MFVKARSLEELEAKLLGIPQEKRQLLIFGGRHLDEGSGNLIVRHHQEWEEYGSVAIPIPAGWTSHGFWSSETKKGEQQTPDESAAQVPTDRHVFEFLSRRGFKVPFINLHGTALTRPSRQEHLQFFKNRRTWLRLRPGMRITPHQYVHPQEILTEYFFQPRRRFRDITPNYIFRIILRKDSWTNQLGPEYLGHDHISAKSLNEFGAVHHIRFKRLLRKLRGIQAIKHG